ncbi:MAG: XshC-Cox1-family protein, partial [Sphingomonadales bacterium]
MLDELDDLLRSTRDWLAEGHKVAIATVIETWGSAPRRRGSHAIIRDDGLFEGSVSGGCVEGDVIFGAQALIHDGGGFERRDYGIQDENAWTFGLACGGKISVLIQTVDDAHYPPALLDEVIERRAQGEAISVVTDLASGASRAGEADSDNVYTNLYPPPLRMMIVGAVHVS